jgi:uncharacterized membrane protein
MNYQSPDNGKTVAIVSYLFLIGWVIALILHFNNRTRLGAFHLRQSLGIALLGIAVSFSRYILHFIPFLGGTVILVLNIGLVVFWVMGLVTAIQGQEKPLPIVGDFFQKTFTGIA